MATPVGKAVVEAVEGVLICCNSFKNFWKPRATVDVVIAHHLLHGCLEVVAYHPEQDVEAPRLYVDAIALQDLMDKDEVDRRALEKKEAFIRRRKSTRRSLIMREVYDTLIINFITSRLQIDTASSTFAVVLTPRAGDVVAEEESGRLALLLTAPPSDLVPVKVTFQHKASSTEMIAAMRNINEEATNVRHMALLSTSSVDGFRMTLAQRMKWASYSAARLRWVRVVHRVVVQLYVEKVKNRLEEIEAKREEARRLRRLQRESRPKRPRILRKSIDASSLPRSRLAEDSVTKTLYSSPQCSHSQNSMLPYLTIRNPSNDTLNSHAMRNIDLNRSVRTSSDIKGKGKAVRVDSVSDDRTLPLLDSVPNSSVTTTQCASSLVPAGSTTRESFSNASESSGSSSGSTAGVIRKKSCVSLPTVPTVLDSYVSKAVVFPRPLSARPAYLLSDAIARTLRCDPPV
eukprot:gene1405-1528_t